MPAQANYSGWVLVAVAVLSMVAGLGVGEMASTRVCGLDGIRGTIMFWGKKVNRRFNVREVEPCVMR